MGSLTAIKSTETHELPPSDPDIERAVLGAAMLEKTALSDVSDILRPEVFYDRANALVWSAIHRLHQRRDPVDILTVVMELRRSGHLDEVGGPFYVSQLTNKVASSANVQYHARLLAQLHMRREQIRIGATMQERGYSDLSDVFDSLGDALADLRMLTEFGTGSARSMGEAVAEGIDPSHKDRGIAFGYEALDRRIRLEPGTVTIIGARPAMGKTSFLLSSAWRQAQAGLRPYIVELEMRDRNLARRLVCGETGVPIWNVKRGQCSEQELDLLAQWHVTHGAAQARITIDESSTMTVGSLGARLDRAKRRDGIDVVWVDYLGLLQPSGRVKGPYERMTAISNELRVLAKDLDLPFAVLAQLSRPPKGSTPKPPALPDLRDSGEIEQDAEAVCFLHRPKYYDANAGDELQFVIAKYRDGVDGMEELTYDASGIRVLDRASWTPAKPKTDHDTPF